MPPQSLTIDHLDKYRSAPPYAIAVFWVSFCVVVAGFFAKGIGSYFLLFAVIPLFYGTHEAVHDTLIPREGLVSRNRKWHNEIVLLLGFAVQGMNYQAVGPSHFNHHALGRFDEGYAPDVAGSVITHREKLEYFLTLLGLPALANQLGCFALVFLPPERAGYSLKLQFRRMHALFPYSVSQLVVGAFLVGMALVGGLAKFVIFELSFCLLWSLLQNVSHYGLKGFDPFTDRVCARTYILPPLLRVLTFGSTAHLAHHVDMQIPGAYLHKPEVIEEVEARIGARIAVSWGIKPFVIDVCRQFRGPVLERDLTLSWLLDPNVRERSEHFEPLSFSSRRGRKWQKTLN